MTRLIRIHWHSNQQAPLFFGTQGNWKMLQSAAAAEVKGWKQDTGICVKVKKRGLF